MSRDSDAIDYASTTDLPSQILRAKDALALRARRKMFTEFTRAIQTDSSTRVLDIGVTPKQRLATNFFEKLYEPKAQITATSFEDASILEEEFPGLHFVQTDGSSLPFADNEFDVAVSFAVLEHVGDREHQRAFVEEMLRVSRKFFVTTPNRWFPLDLHTALPVIHWLPQPTHQRILRSLGKEFWASTENLNLLGPAEFLALFPPDVKPNLVRFHTAGFTSNLLAYGSRG